MDMTEFRISGMDQADILADAYRGPDKEDSKVKC